MSTRGVTLAGLSAEARRALRCKRPQKRDMMLKGFAVNAMKLQADEDEEEKEEAKRAPASAAANYRRM